MPISVCILQVLCLLEASYAFMATYKGHVVFIETKKKNSIPINNLWNYNGFQTLTEPVGMLPSMKPVEHMIV